MTSVSLLGIYPKEWKAGSQINICIPVFIVASFPIVKRWQQPSWGEWMNR